MKTFRIARLSILLCLLLGHGAASAQQPSAKPVAIVFSFTGKATVTIPGKGNRPLRPFDRLPEGTTVKVGPGSHFALAFLNGRLYEFGDRSQATLGRADLASRSGSVHLLPPASPLPRLPAIAEEEHPGLRSGAALIRSERIAGLYPDRGATSLASATRLRFDPEPAAPQYRVQIEDRKGNVLFRLDTQDAEIVVPPDILAPGETYRWTVETVDRPGPVARGEAVLVTLDAGQIRAREKLRLRAQRSGVEDDLKLLEAVDRALGLWDEQRHTADNASCPSPGLVVETVAAESAAFRAGLIPDDRLLSWCRAPNGEEGCVAQGDLRTPFEWLDLQMEDVQRGGVVVEGSRGAESRRWHLLPTFQGLTVAPIFHGALAEVYKVSRDREKAGDSAAAAKELERGVVSTEESHCSAAAIWLLARAAQLYTKSRQWSEADAGYQKAVAKAQDLGRARVETHLQMQWSEAFLQRNDTARARQQLERALQLEEQLHPEDLGVVALLHRLGNVAVRQDHLEEADRLYQRAYDLVLRTAPGSGGEAASASNLALTAGLRGDLAQVERYAARALAIREKLTPDGTGIIPSLVAYGNVLYARGDYAGAESALLRAKKILEKIQSEGIDLVTTLRNLGAIASARGDHDAAEDLFRRALTLAENLDPSGSLERDTLIGLGEVALRQGQGSKAEDWWLRALTISEKANPASLNTAFCYQGLAEAEGLQGRGAEAEAHLLQALSTSQKISPESAGAGLIHLSLGLLLLEQGRVETAEAHLRTAIRLHEKDGKPLPEGYHALARLQVRKGQVEEATASFLAAVDALESQRTRLGGAQESQWLYGSALGDLYFEAAEHQISLGRPQESWRLIERGRARGFQELLAQRDLRFARELPAELYIERHRLAAEYDQVQASLADWLPEQGLEKIEMLQSRLRDLRLEQAQVQERIRRASPRIEALESPTPLDLATARSTLDPGTVLLTYAIGETQSFLFVIEPAGLPGPGLSFYPLAIRKENLLKEVEALRSLLGRPDTDLSTLRQRGRRLYDLLVRPAEPVLRKADRWLISPDGPLHSLPFAALSSGDRYLAELKPIHIVASAGVYKEIKATRSTKPSTTADFLAVGDPLYPASLANTAETTTDPQVQAALRRGFQLVPLPATLNEVKAISDLFPGAQALVGRDATEERVKALAPQARRLHFACHGLLDEKFPLNSALALSIPEKREEGQDNGLLQAWEIFEELRLDADLVTLSACDSGLGQVMGGEGLVGLVRAFQFAGARSVLASLWSVSDVSTADLMKRFYGHLRAGKAKDEALQAAQVELIRSKGFAHPYHWAAFELSGDWR